MTIVTAKPTDQILRTGAHYASISIPWTFNRMMMNSSPKGLNRRALNIVKGVVGQEVLKSLLDTQGIEARVPRKSHREADFFDFRIQFGDQDVKLDLKTVNVYTNYLTGREEFDHALLNNHKSNQGPDWRTFFPMLIPHTQIKQNKNCYTFAIAESIDFRSDLFTNRTNPPQIYAFPYGKWLEFYSSQKLCLKREEANQGFYINVKSTKSVTPVKLTVVGEWQSNLKRIPVEAANSSDELIGPFSIISSFEIDRNCYETLNGDIEVEIVKNEFTDEITNSSGRNINFSPSQSLCFSKNDFCNLTLPDDYTIHYVGWISKPDYLARCRSWSGWIWPNDRENKFHNQPWNMFTDKDRQTLTRAGFIDSASESIQLGAGWLKTHGRGGGACCYFYPNLGRGGGVLETNLYTLYSDLQPLSEIDQVSLIGDDNG